MKTITALWTLPVERRPSYELEVEVDDNATKSTVLKALENKLDEELYDRYWGGDDYDENTFTKITG